MYVGAVWRAQNGLGRQGGYTFAASAEKMSFAINRNILLRLKSRRNNLWCGICGKVVILCLEYVATFFVNVSMFDYIFMHVKTSFLDSQRCVKLSRLILRNR